MPKRHGYSINLKKTYTERLKPKLFLLFYMMVFIIILISLFQYMKINISYNLFLLISVPSYFIFRVIDNYSTIKVSNEFDDDFHKYKLERFVAETSFILPKHPTIRDILSFKVLLIELMMFFFFYFSSLFIVIFFYGSYFVGLAIYFTLLLITPLIYKNNSDYAMFVHNMKKSHKKK